MNDQQAAALTRALDVRCDRAALKNEIAEGTRTVAEVLADVPESAAGMPLFDLLAAQHRWGRSRTLTLLACLNIREGKKLGALTERQRVAISEELMS